MTTFKWFTVFWVCSLGKTQLGRLVLLQVVWAGLTLAFVVSEPRAGSGGSAWPNAHDGQLAEAAGQGASVLRGPLQQGSSGFLVWQLGSKGVRVKVTCHF